MRRPGYRTRRNRTLPDGSRGLVMIGKQQWTWYLLLLHATRIWELVTSSTQSPNTSLPTACNTEHSILPSLCNTSPPIPSRVLGARARTLQFSGGALDAFPVVYGAAAVEDQSHHAVRRPLCDVSDEHCDRGTERLLRPPTVGHVERGLA